MEKEITELKVTVNNLIAEFKKLDQRVYDFILKANTIYVSVKEYEFVRDKRDAQKIAADKEVENIKESVSDLKEEVKDLCSVVRQYMSDRNEMLNIKEHQEKHEKRLDAMEGHFNDTKSGALSKTLLIVLGVAGFLGSLLLVIVLATLGFKGVGH